MHTFLSAATYFIIIYFLILNSVYLYLLVSAIPQVIKKYQEMKIGGTEILTRSKALPPVSSITAAYNEEEVITTTVTSLLNVEYDNFEIIIVDDGSTDNTLGILDDMLDLQEVMPIIPERIKTNTKIKHYYKSRKYHHITVIAKEHSGKADTLNIGINACRSPLFLTFDADSLIEPTAINAITFSMLSESHVIAEGGAVFISNDCVVENGRVIEPRLSYSPLVALQVCEYLRAFFFGRAGWSDFGGPLILSGAIAFFDKQAVIEVGGFAVNAPGEDMELVVRLHHYMSENNRPYKIYYSPVPIIWTHAPSTIKELWSQRKRWHLGEMHSLFSHLDMLFNPKCGNIGFITFPFHLFGEFMGPLVEFSGYIIVTAALCLNVINWPIALLFFIACWGLSTILTIGVMVINIITFSKYKRLSDILWSVCVVFFEMFGYRQMLATCRTYATINFLAKKIATIFKRRKRLPSPPPQTEIANLD